MMHISLRFVILCLCLLSGIDVIAYDAQIDGIYYNFSGDEAEVTYQKYDNSTYRYFSDYSGSVVIPESVTYNGKAYQVTSIGTLAFYQCSSLTSVTIPHSVTIIGIGAFSGCSGLTLITIPENVTSIGEGAFENCINLESITLPNGITGISDVTFVRCSSLKSITIPENVTNIGNYAFSGCSSLERLSLGKNIEEIGTSAFSGCDALQMVKAYWETPIETSGNTFSNTVYNNAKLYVPNGAREAYLATSCWNKFANILPMTVEVKATATEGGSVSINGGDAITDRTQSYWIDCGTEVTFNFDAEEGYRLKSVTANGEDITDRIEDDRFTIASLEGDMTVIAIFSPIVRYSVTASVVTLGGSGGSLDWVLGRSGITKGSLDWVNEGSGAHEGSLDSLDHVVTGVGGTVAVADSIVTSGQSTTVTIIANEGYELKNVTVNGEDKTAEVVDSVLTLTDIREDKAVVATFQKQRFTITAVHGEGGSISLSATTVEWGDSVTAIVTADEGYEVATLKVGSEDISASVVGKKKVKCDIRGVSKDIEVIATFRLDTETAITLTAEDEGTSDNAPVYDLRGRQITNSKSQDSKLRRGIYIRNGKKVMIK